MKKITINLNPRKQSNSGDFFQKTTPFTPLISLAAAAVLVLILALQLVVFKKAHTSSRVSHRERSWQDKADLIRQLKKEIQELDSEKRSLEKLVAPEYEVARILDDLFSSTPKNVWFEHLKFQDDFIDLNGYVVKWDEDCLVTLDRFINLLRKKVYFSQKFSKVNIKDSQKVNFYGVEVLKFIIECKK